MKFIKRLSLAAAMVLPSAAHAAEWAEPASEGLALVQGGLVQIGGPVIGIGLIIIGLIGGLSGKIEWSRVGIMAVAGLLITAGPTMILALMDSMA